MTAARCSLLYVDGHRLRVVTRTGPEQVHRAEVELVTPGGQPLPVAEVETPAAVRLLRSRLRPLLSGSELLGFTLPGLEQASELLFVPRHAEGRLEAILAALYQGGEDAGRFCVASARVGETEVSGLHRAYLYPAASIAPVCRALQQALGRPVPFLDPQFAVLRALPPDAPQDVVALWRAPDGRFALAAVRGGGPQVHGGFLFPGEARPELWLGAGGLAPAETEEPWDLAEARQLGEEALSALGRSSPAGAEPPVVEVDCELDQLLAHLLEAARAGEVPRVLPGDARERAVTARRHRARLRLLAATLLACAAATGLALRARSVVLADGERLRRAAERTARGSLEVRGQEGVLAALRRQRAALRAGAGTGPALRLLAALEEALPRGLRLEGVRLERDPQGRANGGAFALAASARFEAGVPGDARIDGLTRLLSRLRKLPGVGSVRLRPGVDPDRVRLDLRYRPPSAGGGGGA